MVLIHPFEFGTCNHPTFESGCWPAPARNSRRPSCDPFVRPSSYPQHPSRDSPARAAHCSRQSRACSTPFVSAPSSPARDPSFSAAGCFYSAANPAPMMSMAASWGSTSISTSPRAACRQRRPRCRRRALPQRPDPANAAVLSLCPQALLPLRGDVPEGHPVPPPRKRN